MFEVIDLPSGSVLLKGRLTQRKLTAKSRRQVLLCFPSSVEDVKVLHSHLLVAKTLEQVLREDDATEAEQQDMTIFGHLSLSAISGFPLLVVGTNARTFIHFSQIQCLYDENDLRISRVLTIGSACSFSILTAQSEFRFASETSTDYQK